MSLGEEKRQELGEKGFQEFFEQAVIIDLGQAINPVRRSRAEEYDLITYYDHSSRLKDGGDAVRQVGKPRAIGS